MIVEMQWLAFFLSATGNYFINNKNILGIWIWMISNILWITDSIIDFNLPKLLQFITFILFNIHGLYKWNKK